MPARSGEATPTATSGKPDGKGAARSDAFFKTNDGTADTWYVTSLVDDAYKDFAALVGIEFPATASAQQETAQKFSLQKARTNGLLVQLVVEYSIGTGTNAKNQKAIIYCTPEKAKDANLLKNKKYWDTYNIVDVQFAGQ